MVGWRLAAGRHNLCIHELEESIVKVDVVEFDLRLIRRECVVPSPKIVRGVNGC